MQPKKAATETESRFSLPMPPVRSCVLPRGHGQVPQASVASQCVRSGMETSRRVHMESARVQESIRRDREGLAVPLFNQVLNWTPATEAEAGFSTCGGERAPSPRPPAREGDGTGKNAQPSTLPWNKNGEGNAVFLNWLQDQKT